MSYKPEGHSSVSPYLVVTNASEVVEWLEATFDGESMRRHDNPDGTIMHIEVKIDDSVVMIGQVEDVASVQAAMVHVYVEDIDAVFERGLEEGAEVIEQPRERDGELDRRGGLRGPGGNSWWVSTQVK